MNEKQFEVMDYFDNENKPIKAIRDNETTEIYSMDNELEANSVCIKFNELTEEIEQLKQSNRGLKSELQIFKEDVTHSNKIINKLNDKNEQLRLDNSRLLSDYVDVCNENVALETENEQLKLNNEEVIDLIIEGMAEMHDGKRDYAETIFNKAIKLLKGDVE